MTAFDDTTATTSTVIVAGEKVVEGAEGLYEVLKTKRHYYNKDTVADLLTQTDEHRVLQLASLLKIYFLKHLPTAISKRNGFNDYRTNPYVLLTSASIMGLSDPEKFASFLFNSKLYAGLETSFGKSVEGTFVGVYPVGAPDGASWGEPREKAAESKALQGLSRELKSQARLNSVWREIDRSCVFKGRRYLVSIKSGPNCINDTQVAGMVEAIKKHHKTWYAQTKDCYPDVNGLDIVVGLTYGTNATTNNKENQILVKLLSEGFREEDRDTQPGVLIDSTGYIRIYRRIGQEFWSFVGDPADPTKASFTFMEILLALSRALMLTIKEKVDRSLEDRVNQKLVQLGRTLGQMTFPRNSLPQWVRNDFNEDELFWLATALTAFFDKGI